MARKAHRVQNYKRRSSISEPREVIMKTLGENIQAHWAGYGRDPASSRYLSKDKMANKLIEWKRLFA
ncbi:MAG: hypothetical protein M1816_002077 [Peltula sp. TS41687]|nr:MAG: hypothetical protein M1816_002077 [Peltula sp. TS41687]